MKKPILSAALLFLAVLSCTKNEIVSPTPENKVVTDQGRPSETASNSSTAVSDASVNPVAEGKALVEGADCVSCHAVETKLVGPSYQEIAAKYADADLDYLAKKITEGGKGVWGEVPMPAHTGLSEDNAQKIVKYILSLKK